MEPWKALQDGVLEVLKDGISDIASELKPEVSEFLKNQAKAIAKEKWAELRASSDAEKSFARSNLEHLAAQVKGEIIRLELASSSRSRDLLEKVLKTAINILLKVGPLALGL